MGAIGRFFSVHAGATGNDSDIDGNVDGSATAVELYVTPPTGHKWHVHRMIVMIVDGKGMEPIGDYGHIGSALTNGIIIHVEDAAGVKKFDLIGSAHEVKENAGWSDFTYELRVEDWTNTASEAAVARWDFAQAGAPVVLESGEKIVVTIQDDLTGLTEHHFIFQGVDLAYSE